MCNEGRGGCMKRIVRLLWIILVMMTFSMTTLGARTHTIEYL